MGVFWFRDRLFAFLCSFAIRRATFGMGVIAIGVLLAHGPAAAQSKYRESAPDDAYLDGSKNAYYGSENPWNRRMFSRRNAERRYKRRSQRQLLMILEGHIDEAIEECQEWIERKPRDLESRFMLGVAQCRSGDPEKAFATIRQAIDEGLPPERLVAGPRKLLQPLYALDSYKEYRAANPIQLVHGPLLGAVTEHSAQFWVRTAEEAPVRIRAFAEITLPVPIESETVQSQSGTDYTAVLHVDGLSPGTKYRYQVLIGDAKVPLPMQPAGTSPTFRTLPSPGTPGRFRFGFGGGAGYTPEYERMWDTMLAQHLDACFLLGDNVYIDLPQQPNAFHRYTYYRRQSRPEFRRLTGSTPIYAIWDDHDAAIDDVWLGPFRDRPRWKAPMLALFKENWNNPGYGAPDWPACWFRISAGDVDFFFLDCRYYRTNPFAENQTMLGPAQKAWLLDGLKKSDATFKIVVSSVPWAPGAKPGSHDTWDGFSEEREEIFASIDTHRVDGVLLISADRHRSDAWKIERDGGYPLFDFNSSRLTNRHSHEAMPGSLFSYNSKCSFGLVTLDTTLSDPKATYQVINIDGEEIHRLTVRHSELTNRSK